MGELERNPFILSSDQEVFRLREEEKMRKALEKERQQHLKIWQKVSINNNKTSNFRLQRQRQAEPKNIGDRSRANYKNADNKEASGGTRAGKEKENMTDFIVKKREMFLVQMSLDTKREEIRKLEEKAAMKEEALMKSEQMLEEDAVRFDTFLKENDKKAHEAIKRAEKETKLKQDKVQEIKKLNQQIQSIQSDMSKHKEGLEECLEYKAFLESLTPLEWFDQQRQLKKERQSQRRQARMKARMDAWEEEKRKIIADYEAKEKAEEDALSKAPNKQKKKTKDKNGEAGSSAPRHLLPPPPNVDAEPFESSGEDLPLYFNHPKQLLDIFQALEEQNLFLIQNSQETEQALEDLKQNFRETKQKMDSKTTSLQNNIQDLKSQTSLEQAKTEQLKKRISSNTGDAQLKQERLLRQLNDKVLEVYKQCGFDATLKPNTLFMLSELEARLEDLLGMLDGMPEEYVIKAEKEKEKKRREKKRQEQQELQWKMQEERNRKALLRSMQAPKKRTGRQPMPRSRPIRRAIHEEEAEIDQDALDEIRFLSP